MRLKSLNSFEEIVQFLHSNISHGIKKTESWDFALKRTKYLLSLLGDPQNKLKVIHIAGTSGKGSTAYLTSLILNNLNLKVGLQISPHLLDIRERIQINNQLIEKEKFAKYFQEILPFIYKVGNSKFGNPTYYEILTVLAFHTFYKEQVDYAVIETGLGGLYDATNSVTSTEKFVILTKIGLDHVNILGKTISEIALQKAEIIQDSNTVLSIWQVKQARNTIKKIVDQRNAKLIYVKKNTNIKNIKLTPIATKFDFSFNEFHLKGIKLSLLGKHQAENCALALATVYLLSKLDKFEFPHPKWEARIRKALEQANFPGRFEIKNMNGKKIVIDGAHNAQKMSNFLNSLKEIFPKEKFVFLLAFKNDKDFKKMINLIIPFAQKIIITNFFSANQDWLHLPQEPKNIAQYLDVLKFSKYKIFEDNKIALQKALKEKDNLIITGSLYLLSDIYKKV